MGKLIKIVAAVIILLIVVAIALPFIIDPNDYREEIVSAVEKNTGRSLTIEGDMNLTVFPWIGIDIGKLSLGNAEGFGDKPFAAIDEASVRIKLLPLFAKEVVADTITLDGLQLNLAKNKQGVSNWDDLAGTAEKTAEEKDIKDDKPHHEPKGGGLEGLAIGGLNINNATINWQDDTTGQSYQVKNFRLNSGAISPGDPVDLSLGLDLESSQPVMTATLTLDGTVAVDDAVENLSVTPLKVSVDAKGEPFAGGALNASLSSDVTANLKQPAVSLKNLSLQSGDLNLSGQLAASNLTAQPAIDGDIKLAKLNLRKWLNSQGIALPDMANQDALSSFAADIQMKSSADRTDITRLDIGLDQSTINGTAKLAGSHIGFNLNIDQINVDDYLPRSEDKPAVASEDKPAAKPAPADDAPLFPVEMLRTLDVDGKINISKLIASNLTSEQVMTHIVAKKGDININNKVGRFYEGAFDGTTHLNVAGKTPKMAVKANLQNLQAGPLLKDLTGQDKLTGKGRFNLNVNSTGNSIDAIKKTLGGTADFRFENGAVKGVNLAKLLRETKARFEGKPVPKSTEPEQTDFSELSGSAIISKGVINNQDLLAKSPFLRVNGAGTVNLVQESLDYIVEATVVSTAKGQGGEELKDLQGLNIPVKLSGSYMSPDYSIDWGKVLLSSQKAKVDEKVEEKKQELQQKLEEKLGDKLKGFF